ncbi:hypothetical protein diail_4247 [Diaporthe ilicicola]|nr:hypothetical protein diail_4247 [Diaporthe ilicicola]
MSSEASWQAARSSLLRPGSCRASFELRRSVSPILGRKNSNACFPSGINIATPDEVERPTLKAAVEFAVPFSQDEPVPQDISPFEEETQKMRIPGPLVDLLRLMLVVDPRQRPSASAVLKSRELQDFQIL